MKCTKSEVFGMFKRLCKAMGKYDGALSHNNLALDYAPIYGGYVIEELGTDGGCSHPFGCTRRSAREMYLSMHMAAQALEDIKYKQEQLKKLEVV